MDKNSQNIRKRIQNIKKCFDELDNEVVGVGFEPVKDFDDKSTYPIDFQIFMEEFGEMFIGTDRYLVLILEKPKPLIGLLDGSGPETDIFGFNDWVNDDDDFDGCRAQDVKIIANDTDATLYGFDTSRSPYRFLDWSEEVERNFLDWFVNFINKRVIDVHNEFSKTGIKLKDLK